MRPARAERLPPRDVGQSSTMSDETGPSPFRYHLELNPAQLKITHTALRSLLDDFGHEEHDVGKVIREILDKLPDEHAIRAIRLDDEIARGLAEVDPAEPGPGPEPIQPPGGDDDPPDSVA
jgi:hypothetical protein